MWSMSLCGMNFFSQQGLLTANESVWRNCEVNSARLKKAWKGEQPVVSFFAQPAPTLITFTCQPHSQQQNERGNEGSARRLDSSVHNNLHFIWLATGTAKYCPESSSLKPVGTYFCIKLVGTYFCWTNKRFHRTNPCRWYLLVILGIQLLLGTSSFLLVFLGIWWDTTTMHKIWQWRVCFGCTLFLKLGL